MRKDLADAERNLLLSQQTFSLSVSVEKERGDRLEKALRAANKIIADALVGLGTL